MPKTPTFIRSSCLAVLLAISGGCTVSDSDGAKARANLVGRTWTIEDLNGRGVVDGGGPQLVFNDDGALGGRTGCNSILGQYERDGERLTFERLGSTKALCPDALMNQERTMLDILAGVERYRIDDTGTLVLTASDGRTITAR